MVMDSSPERCSGKGQPFRADTQGALVPPRFLVLVFDDLGAEKLTDWVEEQFYLLVGYRYRQRLPILASSNCRKEALAQRLDRRVLDRLRETCTMIGVTGPNQRYKAVQRVPLREKGER